MQAVEIGQVVAVEILKFVGGAVDLILNQLLAAVQLLKARKGKGCRPEAFGKHMGVLVGDPKVAAERIGGAPAVFGEPCAVVLGQIALNRVEVFAGKIVVPADKLHRMTD